MSPLRRVASLGLLLLVSVPIGLAYATPSTLPPRVRRVVLHVPGGPSYERPERRWIFFPPRKTQALWQRRFGTQWIVWTDGSLWPRYPLRGDPPSLRPPLERPADEAWRRRIAAWAAPVYAHVYGANDDTVGIEVSHSGRDDAPFPEAQIRTLSWLLRTLIEMSEGRVNVASITGHKDLDHRPAYVTCERPGCAFFVDAQGRAYRRRVDPPESLFLALAKHGLDVPRVATEGDVELRRAEAMAPGSRPRTLRQ